MDQPSSAQAGIAVTERRLPIEFTASTGEYFRIWIVNLALTVLTLGIYSAWAKVRKRRYFYGHTRIDGEGFEYRANPVAILKGRLIAVAMAAGFYVVSHYAPLYIWALYLVLLVVGPWLVVRSLAYNAYNSAYRNVRFGFSGTYGECFRIVLGYGLLTIVTLGIGYAFLKRRLVKFAMENHSYGTTRFALADGFRKPYVRPYFVVYGIGVLLFVALVGSFALMGAIAGGPGKPGAPTPSWLPTAIFAGVIAFYALLFLQIGYLRARTMNAVWNHLGVGPVRFESALRARGLLWLYFSNLVVLALTIGLAAPWATVRAARYRASRTAAIVTGSLDSFAQGQAQTLGAAGEEIGEMFAFDIAL